MGSLTLDARFGAFFWGEKWAFVLTPTVLNLNPRSECLNPDAIDILGADSASLWGCPVHCGVFARISDLYPLDASSHLPPCRPLQV